MILVGLFVFALGSNGPETGTRTLDSGLLQRCRAEFLLAQGLVSALSEPDLTEQDEDIVLGIVAGLAERLDRVAVEAGSARALAAESRSVLQAALGLEDVVGNGRDERNWLSIHDWCVELGSAADLGASELEPHVYGRIQSLLHLPLSEEGEEKPDLLECAHLAHWLILGLAGGEKGKVLAAELLSRDWVASGIDGIARCEDVHAFVADLRLYGWSLTEDLAIGALLKELRELAGDRKYTAGAILDREAERVAESRSHPEVLIRSQVELYERLEALGVSLQSVKLSWLSIEQWQVGKTHPTGKVPEKLGDTWTLRVSTDKGSSWSDLAQRGERKYWILPPLRYSLSWTPGAEVLLPVSKAALIVRVPDRWPAGYCGIIELSSNEKVLWIRRNPLDPKEIRMTAEQINQGIANPTLGPEDLNVRRDGTVNGKSAVEIWRNGDDISVLPVARTWDEFRLLTGISHTAVLKDKGNDGVLHDQLTTTLDGPVGGSRK